MWEALQIGGLSLSAVKPCDRCKVSPWQHVTRAMLTFVQIHGAMQLASCFFVRACLGNTCGVALALQSTMSPWQVSA